MKTIATLGCITVAGILVAGAAIATALHDLTQEYDPSEPAGGDYIDWLGDKLADRPDAVNATITLAHTMRNDR